jgi:hypothetical protein
MGKLNHTTGRTLVVPMSDGSQEDIFELTLWTEEEQMIRVDGNSHIRILSTPKRVEMTALQVLNLSRFLQRQLVRMDTSSIENRKDNDQNS